MHLPVAHIINAGHDRRPGAQVEQGRAPRAGEGLAKKLDAGPGAGIALVEADDKQPVSFQGVLVDGHPLITAELLQAGAEMAALADKKLVGETIALFFIDKTGWQATQIKPGEICLKPTGMDGGEDDSLATFQRLIERVSAANPGIFDYGSQALAVEDKDQAEGSGKLQVHAAQQTNFGRMIHLGEDRRKILIGHLDPKRKDHPGNRADRGTEKKNERYRQEINEKNGASQYSIF